jgi:hypothetical protein
MGRSPERLRGLTAALLQETLALRADDQKPAAIDPQALRGLKFSEAEFMQ